MMADISEVIWTTPSMLPYSASKMCKGSSIRHQVYVACRGGWTDVELLQRVAVNVYIVAYGKFAVVAC